MGDRITNYALWAYIVLGLLVIVPLAAFMERQFVFEAANMCIIALCMGTVTAFGPASWKILRAPIKGISGGDALIVGIVIASFGAAWVFGTLWLWRALDKPDWIIDHWTGAVARWVLILGSALLMVSTGAKDNTLGLRAYTRAGVIVAAGILVAGILFSMGWG